MSSHSRQRLPIHGRNHLPGGDDPIPGLPPALTGATYTGLILNLPSLVGYWKLNETGGDWADSSMHNNTLAYTSRTGEVRGDPGTVEEGDGVLAVTVAGGSGGSALSASYVGSRTSETDFDFSATDPFTVIAWINPDSLPTGAFSDGVCGSVDLEGGENGQGYGLYIGNDTSEGGAAMFRRRGSAGGSEQASAVDAVPVATDTWSMLAGVFTGTNVELYVNGLLVDTASSPGSFTAGAVDAFYVGSCGISEGVGGTWAPFRGTIDSVALLAADVGDQIAGLYAARGGPETIADGYVLTSDGSGGSSWEIPTIEVDY